MRKELTMQDIADIRAALDRAHDTADHGEPSRVTFDKANHFGPGERGIDVVLGFDGRCLGAQHTVFHFDDGQTPGKRGSLVRAK